MSTYPATEPGLNDNQWVTAPELRLAKGQTTGTEVGPEISCCLNSTAAA
jgi:hypothetical protein